jgi:hypothetical protein
MESDSGKRGFFLITMLILYGLLYFGRLLTILDPSAFPIVHATGPHAYISNLLIFLVGITGLIAIYMWRKWGIYVLAIATIFPIIVDIIYPQGSTWLEHFLSLTPLLIIIWAVYRKWSYMR